MTLSPDATEPDPMTQPYPKRMGPSMLANRLMALTATALISLSGAAGATPSATGANPACMDLPAHAEQAAEAGSAEAQAMVGTFLIDGPCRDSKIARWEGIIWLERASERGHVDAALRLATIFDFGEGVAPDPRRAGLHYRRAARAGLVEAQHRYGMLLITSGNASVREEGLTWLGLAADQGDSLAAAALGLLHARGLHGVERDTCQALLWYDASEALGAPMPLDALRQEVVLHGAPEC
ncbi:MAG: tetratricopeptide repeat protein [Pseudomonadota bacterium]